MISSQRSFHEHGSYSTRVDNKADFVRRFIEGEFGNRTPVWWSIADVPLDYAGELCFRGLAPGFKTVYNVQQPWPAQPPKCYVSSMIPKSVEALGLLQGEVYRSPEYPSLFCSREPVSMKAALERGTQMHGITAVLLLRRFLCPNSLDWLYHLLDTYDGHVIEFSAYAVNYGMLPGFNTLFWEVRNY